MFFYLEYFKTFHFKYNLWSVKHMMYIVGILSLKPFFQGPHKMWLFCQLRRNLGQRNRYTFLLFTATKYSLLFFLIFFVQLCFNLIPCCCFLPCNHRNKWTWVVEEVWTYGNSVIWYCNFFLGRMMDTPVRIPVCPAEHFFLAFKHKPELQDKKLPNVRDYDSRIYLRQTGSSFLMGVFEKQARPWDVTKHGVDPEWNQIKVFD